MGLNALRNKIFRESMISLINYTISFLETHKFIAEKRIETEIHLINRRIYLQLSCGSTNIFSQCAHMVYICTFIEIICCLI